MSGCLRRIGCLVVLLVLCVAGWLTRDLWWERVAGRRPGPAVVWEQVDTIDAPAARRRVRALSESKGEVYASLTPAELGALVIGAAGGRLPSGVHQVEATVQGDALSVRALVDLSTLRSVGGLGPLAPLLTSRQRVTITGRPRVVERGRGAFDVERATVGGVEVPAPVIGSLLGQLDRGTADSGPQGRSISFSLPSYVGDIRVARGRVILYKTTP